MRLPVDLLWLLITTLAALAYFGPRTTSAWPRFVSVAMWLTIGVLAIVALAIKGLTGKGPEDYAAEAIFGTVCRVALISDKCPEAIRAKQAADAANTMANIRKLAEIRAFEERMRRSRAQPLVTCGMRIAEAKLDIRDRKPFEKPIVRSYGDDPSDPLGVQAYYDLPKKGVFVRCVPAAGGAVFEVDIPSQVKVCSLSDRLFACW